MRDRAATGLQPSAGRRRSGKLERHAPSPDPEVCAVVRGILVRAVSGFYERAARRGGLRGPIPAKRALPATSTATRSRRGFRRLRRQRRERTNGDRDRVSGGAPDGPRDSRAFLGGPNFAPTVRAGWCCCARSGEMWCEMAGDDVGPLIERVTAGDPDALDRAGLESQPRCRRRAAGDVDGSVPAHRAAAREMRRSEGAVYMLRSRARSLCAGSRSGPTIRGWRGLRQMTPRNRPSACSSRSGAE